MPLPRRSPPPTSSITAGGPISSVTPLAYTVTYSEFMDPATIGADDFETPRHCRRDHRTVWSISARPPRSMSFRPWGPAARFSSR